MFSNEYCEIFNNSFFTELLKMLKSIATARSECTVKQENKANYNRGYIVPDLIDFFGDDPKEIKTQTEKINIHNCEKYCSD